MEGKNRCFPFQISRYLKLESETVAAHGAQCSFGEIQVRFCIESLTIRSGYSQFLHYALIHFSFLPVT